MSADGDYLGCMSRSTNIILKGDCLKTIPAKFGPTWSSSFREDFCTFLWSSSFREDSKTFSPQGPMLKLCRLLAAILVGKGARVNGYNSEKESPKDHSFKVLSQLAKKFQRRRDLNIFSHRVLC